MVYTLNIDISLCHFPASEDVLRCVCAAIISHNVFSCIFELMSSPQRRSLKTCWQEISFCHKYTQRWTSQDYRGGKERTERAQGIYMDIFPQHHTFIYDVVQRETALRWRIINTQKLREKKPRFKAALVPHCKTQKSRYLTCARERLASPPTPTQCFTANTKCSIFFKTKELRWGFSDTFWEEEGRDHSGFRHYADADEFSCAVCKETLWCY